MKHTAGPWIIEQSEIGGGWWVKQPGIAGFSVALIGHKEAEANARLIAAAPEMYAFIESLGCSCEDSNDHGPQQCDYCKIVSRVGGGK